MSEICNDCGNSTEPAFVRGVSNLAGGEYYNGPALCEKCMVIRRENAILAYEFYIWDSKNNGTGPLTGDY